MATDPLIIINSSVKPSLSRTNPPARNQYPRIPTPRAPLQFTAGNAAPVGPSLYRPTGQGPSGHNGYERGPSPLPSDSDNYNGRPRPPITKAYQAGTGEENVFHDTDQNYYGDNKNKEHEGMTGDAPEEWQQMTTEYKADANDEVDANLGTVDHFTCRSCSGEVRA